MQNKTNEIENKRCEMKKIVSEILNKSDEIEKTS